MLRLSLCISLILCIFTGCTDNNETQQDISSDMKMMDMSDLSDEKDMLPKGCMKDGQPYEHEQEACLNRQLFKCDDGMLVDLNKECGDPFNVDIRITNLKGMSGKVFNIDSVYVTGLLVNKGINEATKVDCTYILKLDGESNDSKTFDFLNSKLKPDDMFEIKVTRNHSDIGKGKKATFEYECTADNEDEEAKSIGNYKKITFEY